MLNKLVIASLLSLIAFQASAQGFEDCSSAFKPLYMDIQVYNRTEKISATEGLVGLNLQSQVELLNSNDLSLRQKVQSLETGFARCEINLSSDEKLAIDMEVENFAKMKNPLIID